MGGQIIRISMMEKKRKRILSMSLAVFLIWVISLFAGTGAAGAEEVRKRLRKDTVPPKRT